MNKKGADVMYSLIIFIILNILFFSVIFYFVARVGSSNATFYEQITAKQVAFLLDASKPGTEFTLDLSKAYEIARKNHVLGQSIVKIDNEKKEVRVTLTQDSKGYVFRYFSDVQIEYADNFHYGKLVVRVK